MEEQLEFPSDNGNEKKTRADQIFERFARFHIHNPAFWKLFCRFGDEMRRILDHYSAQGIFERARFEHAFESVNTDNDSLRLNNDYVAYYARMYIATHPGSEDFFELRRRTSETRDAFNIDITVFHSGDPGDESALFATLRALGSLDKSD